MQDLEIRPRSRLEVLPPDLTNATQRVLLVEPAWCIDEDGTLNLDRRLEPFQKYFRESAEHWLQLSQY